MELLNRVLGKNDKDAKLRSEIESLEVRKTSVIGVIQNEIAQLEREINSVYQEAGKRGYCNYKQDRESAESLQEFWMKIEEIEKAIVEKNEKKTSMEARYDEEISLLQHDLYSAVPKAAQNVCPKCGASVDEGDAFCQKCGNALK